MIPYSHMTLDDLYHNVIIRAGILRGVENISYEMVRRMAIRAVQEAVATTIPYKEWAYIKYTTDGLSNGGALPIEDFTQAIKVVEIDIDLDEDPIVERIGVEYRRVSPKEYFTLTNSTNSHSWNKSVNSSPIYTIWGQGGALRIYFEPSIDRICRVYYPSIPHTISRDGSHLIPIPYEYEELVILLTLTRLYVKIGELDMLEKLYTRINQERKRIYTTVAVKKEISKRALDDFTKEVVPFVSLQPLPGQVKEVFR